MQRILLVIYIILATTLCGYSQKTNDPVELAIINKKWVLNEFYMDSALVSEEVMSNKMFFDFHANDSCTVTFAGTTSEIFWEYTPAGINSRAEDYFALAGGFFSDEGFKFIYGDEYNVIFGMDFSQDEEGLFKTCEFRLIPYLE